MMETLQNYAFTSRYVMILIIFDRLGLIHGSSLELSYIVVWDM
jgi:hypothetical protein